MWREHLPYNSAIDVAASAEKIYSATPFSLFTVDLNNHSIERLSRVTGLSETGISCIEYDAANQKLVVAYSNSNIDIIYRADIFNIPDLKRDNTIGDKTIYAIYPLAGNYYLSTGLGVIVIDGTRYEIKTIRSAFPHISLETALKWATLNGATALQLQSLMGSFEKGKKPGVNLITRNGESVRRLI